MTEIISDRMGEMERTVECTTECTTECGFECATECGFECAPEIVTGLRAARGYFLMRFCNRMDCGLLGNYYLIRGPLIVTSGQHMVS